MDLSRCSRLAIFLGFILSSLLHMRAKRISSEDITVHGIGAKAGCKHEKVKSKFNHGHVRATNYKCGVENENTITFISLYS